MKSPFLKLKSSRSTEIHIHMFGVFSFKGQRIVSKSLRHFKNKNYNNDLYYLVFLSSFFVFVFLKNFKPSLPKTLSELIINLQ